MPYHVEFVRRGHRFHLTGSGTVLGSEIVAGAARPIATRPGRAALRYALVDLTELTEFRVTTEEVRQIVAEDMITARLAPGVVVAIVAPRDYAFGMARMWQAFAEVHRLGTRRCSGPRGLERPRPARSGSARDKVWRRVTAPAADTGLRLVLFLLLIIGLGSLASAVQLLRSRRGRRQESFRSPGCCW